MKKKSNKSTIRLTSDVSRFGRLAPEHHNNYTFTKALAEDVVFDEAKELPAIIIRPPVGEFQKIRTELPKDEFELLSSVNSYPIILSLSLGVVSQVSQKVVM